MQHGAGGDDGGCLLNKSNGKVCADDVSRSSWVAFVTPIEKHHHIQGLLACWLCGDVVGKEACNEKADECVCAATLE